MNTLKDELRQRIGNSDNYGRYAESSLRVIIGNQIGIMKALLELLPDESPKQTRHDVYNLPIEKK